MNEQKVIEGLLSSLENDKEPFYVKMWFKVIFWFLIVVCFYGFNWMLDHNVSKYITLLAPCLLGLVVGFIAFLQFSDKSWPIVKQHLNKKSLQERLDKLNA